MICPNCPGPKVPHRCSKELSLAERLAALNQSSRRGVPAKRLSLIPAPAREFAPSPTVSTLCQEIYVSKVDTQVDTHSVTTNPTDVEACEADSASLASTGDLEAQSEAGESSIVSVLCARDFEFNSDAGESSPSTEVSQHQRPGTEDHETDSEAGESSIGSVLCARDFESDCEICKMSTEQ